MKCLYCKKEIIKKGRKGRGKKFCSKKCFYAGSTINTFKKGNIPFYKGKKRPPLTIKQRQNISDAHRGKKLSDITKKKISDSHKGEKSHFWKGGITPIHTKIRMSLEYKLWKKSVFERDNFTCQKYKTGGGDLIAHHINNFSEFPELRFAIDNGITLSNKAHKEFHKKYGMKNNTREQLEEFLNNL